MTPMQNDSKAFRYPCRIAIVPLVLAAVLLMSAPGEAELRNQVTLGYDSFIDRFTILEADTLESTQELYIRFGNALQYRKGKTTAGLNNLFKFGNQTVDEHLDAEGSVAPLSSAGLDLRSSLHWRHFQEGSDYEFGNDYTQANAMIRIRTDIGTSSRLSLKSRLEAVDYGEKTDFDYDYRYIDGGVEIQIGDVIDKMLLAGVFAGRRDAPDTTALSYDRLLGELEATLTPGVISIHVASAVDRRDYRGTVRSSSWNAVSSLETSVSAANGSMYSLRGESELIRFDRPDTAYFDTHFLRALFRARIPLGSMSSVFVEPRYGRMLCDGFEEERYAELSCVFGTQVMRNDRLWFDFSYEPGYRNYLLGGNELYSDFYLNRLSIMGSLSLPYRMTLNLFITHEPERHSRREDDFSVTLMSIDLTRRF
jgi:hypothetical protein